MATGSGFLVEESHHAAPFPPMWSGAETVQQPGDHVRYLVGHRLIEECLRLQPGDAEVVADYQTAVCCMADLAGRFAPQVTTYLDSGCGAAMTTQQWGRTLQPVPSGGLQFLAKSV